MDLFEKLTPSGAPRPRTPNRRKAWFFRPAHVPWQRRICWHRIAGLMLALGLVGYLSAATALWAYTRHHRGISTIAFADLALPFRWDRYRIKIGEHQLAQAEQFLLAGKFAEADTFARAGLARAPDHRDGRLLAARLLYAAKHTDAARQTLLDGLELHALDPLFLGPTLEFLRLQQDDREIVALARRLAPRAASSREVAALLAGAAAGASLARGNFDAAEDFLRAAHAFATSLTGRHLQAQIDWDRGLRTLALVRLRQLAEEHPRDPAIHRDLAHWLRLSGQPDEARRTALALRLALPDRAESRVELLREYHAAGNRERVASELDALLRDFAADSSALLLAADFTATAGLPDLTRRIAERARARQLPGAPFDLLVAEALTAAKDFQAALDAIRQLQTELGAPASPHRATLAGLLAIAHLGLGDPIASRTHLATLLDAGGVRAATLLSVARRLDDMGAKDSARQLLARTFELDPLNQAALTRMIELDLESGRFDEIHAFVPRLLAMRRPSPDLLRSVQHSLSGDRFLFSQDAAATVALISSYSVGGGRSVN